MKHYKNVGTERVAHMERIPESYGFYRNELVLVSTDNNGRHAFARVGSYAEGVAWLNAEFGGGWIRVRS